MSTIFSAHLKVVPIKMFSLLISVFIKVALKTTCLSIIVVFTLETEVNL